MNISIIIPVYNVETYIERCLRSVINQTFTEGVECILIDDCTPDNSMRIAEKLINEYKGNILFRIVSHQHNGGQAAVRNTGISVAKGTYILFVDSDDYCESDMLEKLYSEAIKTNADIIGCDFYLDFGKYKKIQHFNFLPSPTYNLKQLLEGNYWGVLWSRLIRRDLFIKYNLHFIEKLNYGEGFIMLVKLHYYAQKVAYVARPLYNYVKYNAQSITYSLDLDKINQRIKTHQIIETFLKEKQIYDIYKISFLKSCFWATSPLVTNPQIRNLTLWKSTYPESHIYIKEYNYNFKLSLFWLLICNLPLRIVAFILWIFDLAHK